MRTHLVSSLGSPYTASTSVPSRMYVIHCQLNACSSTTYGVCATSFNTFQFFRHLTPHRYSLVAFKLSCLAPCRLRKTPSSMREIVRLSRHILHLGRVHDLSYRLSQAALCHDIPIWYGAPRGFSVALARTDSVRGVALCYCIWAKSFPKCGISTEQSD